MSDEPASVGLQGAQLSARERRAAPAAGRVAGCVSPSRVTASSKGCPFVGSPRRPDRVGPDVNYGQVGHGQARERPAADGPAVTALRRRVGLPRSPSGRFPQKPGWRPPRRPPPPGGRAFSPPNCPGRLAQTTRMPPHPLCASGSTSAPVTPSPLQTCATNHPCAKATPASRSLPITYPGAYRRPATASPHPDPHPHIEGGPAPGEQVKAAGCSGGLVVLVAFCGLGCGAAV